MSKGQTVDRQRERRNFFISYSHVDRAWAEWLAWVLVDHGWTVELDVWDWPAGADFVEEMQYALENADRVLAVFSPAYFQGPFAGAEMRAAFAQTVRGKARLTPVLVEDCDVPPLVSNLLQIRLVGLTEADAEQRLVHDLLGGRPSARPPFPAADTVRNSVNLPPRRARFPGPPLFNEPPPLPPARSDPPPKHRPVWRGWTPQLMVALGAVVLLGLTLGIVATYRSLTDASIVAGCPVATELPVLTTPDGLPTVRAVADRYQKATVDPATRCPRVNPYVYAPDPGVSPQVITAALANGWADDDKTKPGRDIGPRPDVWLPESSVEVAEVRDTAAKSHQRDPVAGHQSIASSPIVVGLLGGSPAAPTGRPAWQQLLDGTTRPLFRADPTGSATGAVAALATYAAAAGGRPSPTQLRGPVRRIEQRVRAALDAAGLPAGSTSADLLCRQRSEPTRPIAIITSEQSLKRYNSGAALSAGCGALERRVPNDQQAQIVQPDRTYLLDYPLVRFSWTVSGRVRAQITEFAAWLRDTSGRSALHEEGLRPPQPRPVMIPAADLGTAAQLYRAAQTPATVLLVVDTSGSMEQPVAGSGQRRFDVVRAGVTESLAQMGVRDRFGLWGFPGGTGTGHRELLPIGPSAQDRRQQASSQLHKVTPAGRTPLYRTIIDAARAAGRDTPVVLLTDGENDDAGGPTEADVRTALHAAGTPLYLVAVGEARCAGGPLDRLAGKRCFETDFSSARQTLTRLLDTLWGGN